MTRPSGRAPDELRRVSFSRGFAKHAEGSVLIQCGDTHVLCTASVEDTVPPFLRGKGQGWVTAEYEHVAPRRPIRAPVRRARPPSGKQSGRTQEIQRLIGRSLRAIIDLKALGERTCIAIGLRCVAGGRRHTHRLDHRCGYVALCPGVRIAGEKTRRLIAASPLHGQIGAISVGIVGGIPGLDLDYAEDSQAETDMNIVMNNGGAFVEVQGTAEGHAFRRHELDAMLNLAANGIGQLFALQLQALAPRPGPWCGWTSRVLASGNVGKLREMSALLAPLGFPSC